MKYNKKIVAIIVILNICFSMGVMYVNLRGGIVSDTLIEWWFKFTTIELGFVAGIKVVEIFKGGGDSGI